MIEAATKVCEGFSDHVRHRMVAEMKTPIRQKRRPNGLCMNPKNETLRAKRSQLQQLIKQYKSEEVAWEAAKKMSFNELSELAVTTKHIPSGVDAVNLSDEQKQFLAKGTGTEVTKQILQHARTVSLKVDSIERAVVAVEIFAKDYQRGHTQLVHAFQAQNKSTYGDVSNARQIVAQLIRV